jgi:hypothetical protein
MSLRMMLNFDNSSVIIALDSTTKIDFLPNTLEF